MFDVRAPSELVAIPDVPLGTPLADAAQAIFPYLNGKALCPGCVLGANFLPDLAVTRGAMAVVLVSVLTAQHKIELLDQAESEQILSAIQDASQLPRSARVFLSTAVRKGLLDLRSGGKIESNAPAARVDLALHLDRIQQDLGIPHK
jgi:hypothetical protein